MCQTPYVVLLALAAAGAVEAQEGRKALPVLLVRGEVVSLDTSDPAATLLTIKDRYGFETPVFVTPETPVTQGGAAYELAGLAAGTTISVEYSFDTNTAKRHAVSLEVAAPTPQAPDATPAPEATSPAAPATPSSAVSPEAATPPAESGTSAPGSAPAGSEAGE